MNQENRHRVEEYLNSRRVESTAPLIFEGYTSNKEEFDPEKYSVEDMIERTLELSKNYYSINSENEIVETRNDRSRSSLDIWRHIKYYYPDITIFHVMQSLYNMGRELQEVGGLFCPDINRRVFRLQRLEDDGDYGTEFDWSRDEYSLDFDDWEDI